ncbi:MAG: SelB C-terminal domain-containing protein, partial [Gammaproteobacteria bacterium]|nr:SelB C-terminal domain-containing protein [Gammaproteobacteria bacterium]
EIAALVGGTFLRDASVIDVSCEDGRGIDELRAELERAAAGHAIEQADDEFRLAIDRTFNVRGAGLVVTGTVVSGSVRTGDTVAVAASGNSLRVRSLHVQDRAADVATIGDRAAINLTGAARDVLARGDWIVAPSALKSTAHPCVALGVLADFPRPVKHWAPVHVYHATSHCQARIGLLEGAPVEPGGRALVDLICDEPLYVKIGDRVIVRDQDLGRTMGGGTVIDLEVPVGRRRHPRRRERLASLAELDIREAANWLSLRQVVSLDDFGRSWNIKAERVQTFVSDLGLVKRGDQVVHSKLFERFKADVTNVLEAHHREIADSDGMSAVELRAKLAADVQTLEFVLAALVDADFLRVRNGRYAVPTHQAEIPKALQSLFDAMKTLLDSNQPPSLGDLAKSLDRPLKVFSRDMRALVAVGLCIQVSPNRFYLPARLHAMADIANTLNSRSPFTVRDFRDASGVGRNVVIEVLEYFDTRGFTRREGDQRRVIASIESTLDG